MWSITWSARNYTGIPLPATAFISRVSSLGIASELKLLNKPEGQSPERAVLRRLRPHTLKIVWHRR